MSHQLPKFTHELNLSYDQGDPLVHHGVPIDFRPSGSVTVLGLELWAVRYQGRGTVTRTPEGLSVQADAPLLKERAAWWRLALWHLVGRWFVRR